MVKFTKLRYKNILATGNAWTELDLGKHDTALVVGSNGEGKSTFLDALAFVCYGRPYRKNFKKSQLVNSVNNGGLLVELDFLTDRDSYLVRRGIKPVIFEIHKNGTLLNQEAVSRDYQDILTGILGMNFNTFIHTVVIGKETYEPFMRLDTPRRRGIVENLLDMEIFTAMNAALKERADENRESIELKSREVDMAAEQHRHAVTVADISRDSLSGQLEALNSKIGVHSSRVGVLKEKISESKGHVTSKRTTINRKLSKLETKISELATAMADSSAKQREATRVAEFLRASAKCDKCQQPIDEAFKNNKIVKKEKKAQEFQDWGICLATHLQNTKNTKSGILKEEASIRLEEDQIHRDESELSVLESSIHLMERERRSLQSRMEVDVSGLSDVADALGASHAAKKAELDALNEESRRLKIAAILLKDDGIKSRIVKSNLPTINSLVQKYLRILDYRLNFTLDENFEEKIKQAGFDNYTYSSFSMGERMRIDMAILFAWRDLAKMKASAHTNLLVMDEIFDSSLDESGVDDFMKMLKHIAKDGTSIFIVSHRGDVLVDKFDRTLKFEKVGGFSRCTVS